MVPTLTMLGRFSAATRGAAIPWFETTLVTHNSMAGQRREVTSIPPRFYEATFGHATVLCQQRLILEKIGC